MMCKTCAGSSEIVRDTYTVSKHVDRSELRDGRVIWEPQEVRFSVGGVDACPVCAAHAEVDYQMRLKHGK